MKIRNIALFLICCLFVLNSYAVVINSINITQGQDAEGKRLNRQFRILAIRLINLDNSRRGTQPLIRRIAAEADVPPSLEITNGECGSNIPLNDVSIEECSSNGLHIDVSINGGVAIDTWVQLPPGKYPDGKIILKTVEGAQLFEAVVPASISAIRVMPGPSGSVPSVGSVLAAAAGGLQKDPRRPDESADRKEQPPGMVGGFVFDKRAEQDFMRQPLQDAGVFISLMPQIGNYKTWIENPTYQGASNIYKDYEHDGLCDVRYPKVPRVHCYNHNPQITFFSIEIPKTLVRAIPSEIFGKIFGEIPRENVSLFIVVQTGTMAQDEGELLLRPQYYTDLDVPNVDYNVGRKVAVALFPLDTQHLKLEGEEGVLLKNQDISNHPGDNGQKHEVPGRETRTTILSGNNLKITGYDKREKAYFCTLVISPEQNKAALTFHYLPGVGEVERLTFWATSARTIRDFFRLPAFENFMENFPWVITNVAETIKSK